jgi:hypothetical protein
MLPNFHSRHLNTTDHVREFGVRHKIVRR